MQRYVLESIDALMRTADTGDVPAGTTLDMAVPQGLNPGSVLTLEQQARALIAEHAQQVPTTVGGAM